jgi:hypothetical protein
VSDWAQFLGAYVAVLCSVGLIPVGQWVIDRISF